MMCSTGKDGFGTMQSALQVAQYSSDRRGVTLRVYRCKLCKKLHLTSKVTANKWHVKPAQQAQVAA